MPCGHIVHYAKIQKHAGRTQIRQPLADKRRKFEYPFEFNRLLCHYRIIVFHFEPPY